jgi:hypothetical protein
MCGFYACLHGSLSLPPGTTDTYTRSLRVWKLYLMSTHSCILAGICIDSVEEGQSYYYLKKKKLGGAPFLVSVLRSQYIMTNVNQHPNASCNKKFLCSLVILINLLNLNQSLFLLLAVKGIR